MIENEYNIKGRASNERFCEIAGVNPLKRHYELATACPAATSVNPATSQSRVDVARKSAATVRNGHRQNELWELLSKIPQRVDTNFK